jgi:hypothetical protein
LKNAMEESVQRVLISDTELMDQSHQVINV